MFSAHVDGKQCRDGFQQPYSCGPSVGLWPVALRSSFIRSLLPDLDHYGGNHSDGMLLLFYKQVVRELAPKLAVFFKHLVTGGSLPACWRLADVVSVPNRSPSSDVEDYRSISITPLLSKVFEIIVAEKLSNFLDSYCLLPPSQFLYRRGL